MQKLTVKNFSVIKDVQLSTNRFLIFIGKEASGKSVISKLLFFFKEVVPEVILLNSDNQHNITTLKNSLKKDFKEIFPIYFWNKQDFFIEFKYSAKDTWIIVKHDDAPAPKIKIELSEKFKEKFKEIKNERLRQTNDLRTIDKIRQRISKKLFGNKIVTDFLPSSRSFFSLIQTSIFTLGLYGQVLDIFIQKFGSQLEIIKKQLQHIEIEDTIKKISREILKGEYYFDGKEDWIYTLEKNQIKLKDSSSGQQEVTPILIWLTAISSYKDDYINEIIIEEPETHLFPDSQKKLVELFGYLYNLHNTNFVITTHSPYILTSLNNLIYAYEIAQKGKPQDVAKIIQKEKWINFNDISVYFLQDGKLRDIKNYENKLIDAEPIDEISNEISIEFDKLLDLDDE